MKFLFRAFAPFYPPRTLSLSSRLSNNTIRSLSTSPSSHQLLAIMGHPPRKAPTGDKPAGRRGGGHHPYRNRGPPKPSGAQNDMSTIAAPPRPTVEPSAAPARMDAAEIKRLYSTSAGTEPQTFGSLGKKLDPTLLQALEKMGFEFMSPVQQKVLTQLPTLTSDCLVQAKTGTGKTAAFLLPSIQNLLQGNAPPRGKVGILVICPTRELALQIAKEADGITACLARKMECHTAFGGTARASNLNKFLNGNPTILVATPGRLNDLLGEDLVREKFTHIKTVILDEADRMLDQGFAPDIHKVLKRLPSKQQQPGWQGMCFSATLPEKVNDVVKCVLYPGYTSLSTIDTNEAPTIDRVPQYSVIVPSMTQMFTTLQALIETEYEQNPEDFKAIVFGTTANGVALLYDLYQKSLPKFRMFQLQSRMAQNARTRTTNEFKETSSGILFASDVVGRGMDFPNVGLVIQLGLPSAAEQYIHRVGRTARAGKDGRAVTLLYQNESFFVHTNPSLPIKPYPTNLSAKAAQYQPVIDNAFTQVDEEAKAKAYQAFLGYNKTFAKKLQLSLGNLVAVANEYSRTMGCPEPPLIEKKTIGKMGLKGVSGLNIGSRRGEH